MPIRQRDRGVVRMTNAATRINARVATQRLPTPLRSAWLVLQQLAIAPFADSIRVLGAYVNEFSTHAIEFFDDVGLARTAAKRLVAQDELLVDRIPPPGRSRAEEPFTLTTKRAVLAAVSQSGWDSEQVLVPSDERRLQRLLSLCDTGCAPGTAATNHARSSCPHRKRSSFPSGLRTNRSR